MSKINVKIHDPIVIADGVFKTKITCQGLDGELSFIHGVNNRDQTLSSLENSLADDINELAGTFKKFLSK